MRTKSKRVAKTARKAGRRDGNKAWRGRLRPIAGIAALVVGGAGLAWWAHQSLVAMPYFRVSEVRIRGNASVSTTEIVSRLGIEAPVSTFQLDLEGMAGRIATHPWIRSASIQRQLPLGLLVTVEEREPAAVLRAGKTYLLSADAMILEEVQGRPPADLPLFRATWRAAIQPGERFDDPRLVRGLALVESLHDAPLIRPQRVVEVTMEADGNYIMHLEGGGAILRVGATEPLRQLDRLAAALRDRGQELKHFAYADLRFPGRVILKPPEKGG